MKVTRNTPDQLIVADTPWLIGIMIVFFILTFVSSGLAVTLQGEWAGLIFVIGGGGLGVGAFAAFVRRVQVIFDRPGNSITIRRRSVFGFDEIAHDLSDLRGAILESTSSDKGGRLYRPTLVLDAGMSEGRHPIVDSYTSGSGAQRITDAVNAWLDAARVDSGATTL